MDDSNLNKNDLKNPKMIVSVDKQEIICIQNQIRNRKKDLFLYEDTAVGLSWQGCSAAKH